MLGLAKQQYVNKTPWLQDTVLIGKEMSHDWGVVVSRAKKKKRERERETKNFCFLLLPGFWTEIPLIIFTLLISVLSRAITQFGKYTSERLLPRLFPNHVG